MDNFKFTIMLIVSLGGAYVVGYSVGVRHGVKSFTELLVKAGKQVKAKNESKDTSMMS